MKKNIFTIIITFLIGAFAGHKLCKTEYYLRAKEVAKELLSTTAESITPCELVVVMRYNQDEESTITDFSQYEKRKRVGLIMNKTEANPHEDDLDEDIIVYPQAVVYKIGETWLWKVL